MQNTKHLMFSLNGLSYLILLHISSHCLSENYLLFVSETRNGLA